ncbi:MAG: hypothetical protein H6622_04065 [Halobacteriovoraceae bacterium]|nr:hypothetical protein [Halobacteriovoraceae bacterium]
MKLFFVFISIFVSSEVFASKFKVTSNPAEAEVFVRSPDNQNYRKVGKTPIDMDISEFISAYSTSNNFFIKITKPGHEDFKALIARGNKTSIELDVRLDQSQDVVLMKKFDSIHKKLFESQRLIRIKSYDQAIKMLENIEIDFIPVSAVYEMLGSAFYLKKDFKNSLNYYRKAFSLNADNLDAYAMMAYLEKSLGVATGRGK